MIQTRTQEIASLFVNPVTTPLSVATFVGESFFITLFCHRKIENKMKSLHNAKAVACC